MFSGITKESRFLSRDFLSVDSASVGCRDDVRDELDALRLVWMVAGVAVVGDVGTRGGVTNVDGGRGN